MKDPENLTVGKFLQEERGRKGLSLDAVSKVTRISSKSLEALEGDDFMALPAPIFIRSFLKTYASFLGLNTDRVIALYESQTGMIGVPSPKGAQPEKGSPRVLFFIVIPLLVALVGGGIYWFSSSRKGPALPPSPSLSLSPSKGTAPETAPTPPPPPPAPPSREAPKEPEKAQPPQKQEVRLSPPKPQPSPQHSVASSEVAPGASSDEKKERRHILRVQAREQTWVRVQADDQPEFEVLLEPKEKAVWTARREMKVTLGNAGGVDLTFNGKKIRGFGESGQVVHLQFPQKAEMKGE